MHEWIIQCGGMRLDVEDGKETAEAEAAGDTGDVADEAKDGAEETADETTSEAEDGAEEGAEERTNRAEESDNVATSSRADNAESGVEGGEDELEEVSDDLGEVLGGDLGGALDGGEDNINGLASKLVDVVDGAVDDGLDLVNNGGDRLDSGVGRSEELEISDDGGHSDNNVVEDLGDAGGSDVASADLSLKLDGKGGGGREDGHGAEGEGGKGGNVLEGEHFEKNVGVCSTERGLRVEGCRNLTRRSMRTNRYVAPAFIPAEALYVTSTPKHACSRSPRVSPRRIVRGDSLASKKQARRSAHGNKSAVARDR